MMRSECCATCNKNMQIEKYDYSHGGCEHTRYEGFACLAFIHEGLVVHMVGLDPNGGQCEMYSRYKGYLQQKGDSE